ncbi:glucose-6-phosphate dehydrogenase, partial [Staphylococcus piscifermentans]
MKKNISALITIFGATGDLSYRKLFPSIYNLFQKGYFAESVAIIGAGIDQLTTEEFRKQVKAAIQNHIDNPEKVESFLKHLFYKQQDVNDTASYESLLQLSQKLEDQFNLEGNRLFYLAMSPNFFGIVAKNLKDSGLTNTKGFKRIIIEKPFGD